MLMPSVKCTIGTRHFPPTEDPQRRAHKTKLTFVEEELAIVASSKVDELHREGEASLNGENFTHRPSALVL